jgi:PAS domain-containing protein
MLKDKEIQREELILDMAVDGFWDWDLKADRVYLSPKFCACIGYFWISPARSRWRVK